MSLLIHFRETDLSKLFREDQYVLEVQNLWDALQIMVPLETRFVRSLSFWNVTFLTLFCSQRSASIHIASQTVERQKVAPSNLRSSECATNAHYSNFTCQHDISMTLIGGRIMLTMQVVRRSYL